MIINLTTIQTLAIAVAALYLGKFINNRFSFLKEMCIPDAVTGGVIFSTLTFIGFQTDLLVVSFEGSLRELFMIAFFTTVGYSASIKLLKKAGFPVLMFLVAAVGLAILQNVVGVGVAELIGINPLLGLATGSISTTGGPGTAGAFAPMLESKGAVGATAIAMATATYALIAGSVIGGPIAKKLITKNKLIEGNKNDSSNDGLSINNSTKLNKSDLSPAAFQIILAMGIGSLISTFLTNLGLILPSYIGAMFAASMIRNISDFSGKFEVKLDAIDALGGLNLSMFLSMTLMSFKLWELKGLGIPLIILLASQTLLMAGFAYFGTFYLMGKDYDAAVMATGHCGCGFGTTPKALANMEAFTNKFKPSPKAFFVIPLVGGLFIDFFNAAIITVFVNLV